MKTPSTLSAKVSNRSIVHLRAHGSTTTQHTGSMIGSGTATLKTYHRGGCRHCRRVAPRPRPRCPRSTSAIGSRKARPVTSWAARVSGMSARAPGFPINDSTAVEITVYRGSLSLAAREHFSDRLVPEDEVDRLHGHARPVGDLLRTGLARHELRSRCMRRGRPSTPAADPSSAHAHRVTVRVHRPVGEHDAAAAELGRPGHLEGCGDAVAEQALPLTANDGADP